MSNQYGCVSFFPKFMDEKKIYPEAYLHIGETHIYTNIKPRKIHFYVQALK